MSAQEPTWEQRITALVREYQQKGPSDDDADADNKPMMALELSQALGDMLDEETWAIGSQVKLEAGLTALHQALATPDPEWLVLCGPDILHMVLDASGCTYQSSDAAQLPRIHPIVHAIADISSPRELILTCARNWIGIRQQLEAKVDEGAINNYILDHLVLMWEGVATVAFSAYDRLNPMKNIIFLQSILTDAANAVLPLSKAIAAAKDEDNGSSYQIIAALLLRVSEEFLSRFIHNFNTRTMSLPSTPIYKEIIAQFAIAISPLIYRLGETRDLTGQFFAQFIPRYRPVHRGGPPSEGDVHPKTILPLQLTSLSYLKIVDLISPSIASLIRNGPSGSFILDDPIVEKEEYAYAKVYFLAMAYISYLSPSAPPQPVSFPGPLSPLWVFLHVLPIIIPALWSGQDDAMVDAALFLSFSTTLALPDHTLTSDHLIGDVNPSGVNLLRWIEALTDCAATNQDARRRFQSFELISVIVSRCADPVLQDLLLTYLLHRTRFPKVREATVPLVQACLSRAFTSHAGEVPEAQCIVWEDFLSGVFIFSEDNIPSPDLTDPAEFHHHLGFILSALNLYLFTLISPSLRSLSFQGTPSRQTIYQGWIEPMRTYFMEALAKNVDSIDENAQADQAMHSMILHVISRISSVPLLTPNP